MTRKRIWAVALVGVTVAIVIYAYREYNRKAESLVTATPGYEVSDSLLLAELSGNEQLYTQKYTDKIVLVTGTIKSIDKTTSQVIITLGRSDDISSVKCQLDSTQVLPVLSEGVPAAVKGLFIGFNRDTLTGSDVTLSRCVIVKPK